MTHIWVRAEIRDNERRVGLMPDGMTHLLAHGFQVTVEDDPTRAVPIDAFRESGAAIASPGDWRDAPDDTFVLGLKELPADGSPLRHRHIMFGHAFKGQTEGQELLARFAAGGGTLYDLEYLTDELGRRVAAFGYWAGFAGAAVSLIAWGSAVGGRPCPPMHVFDSEADLLDAARAALGEAYPKTIVIGALGRVGTGASDVISALGLSLTPWDMAETAHDGPFPAILDHDVFLNCILAAPGVPVFVPSQAVHASRRLRIIGDIACDPQSDFNPIPLYTEATTWDAPVHVLGGAPPLQIMAIDNLPSMLPQQSSEDFAAQLLPHLAALDKSDQGVWARAKDVFLRHSSDLENSR